MSIEKEKDWTADAGELRRRAEKRLRAKMADSSVFRSEEEMRRLLHELEVHQIELEMQNEELRQARAGMESALERYTDLYDFAPIGYFTLNHDGIILGANLTGANLLGIERSRLLGRNLARFLAADAGQFSEFLGKVFASEAKETSEVTFAGEGNHQHVVLIEALANAARTECRIAVVNVTERRRAEDALAEKHKELEGLNRTLEERIARTLEELRQKDQLMQLQDRQAMMGEMLHNIAHQWRQPLNTLGLVVQQLPLSFDTGDFSKEYLEENVALAMKVIQQMSGTIDDFRNFFMSDKEAIAFPVRQVIARTLSLVEKAFKDSKINIAVQVEAEPAANGYPSEYSQVLLNILLNARDALIARKVENAQITIHAFAEGDRTVVTITDNGGGIDEKIIDKIFDPYFTTKGPEKGTGIGLYMSKTIIEKNMGGRLTARNTGNGAEFRIEV